MLHLVRPWHALDSDQRRHLRIVAGQAADNAAQRAPIVELAWRPRQFDQESRLPMRVEMIAVTRRAPGEAGTQGRRPTLEIRTRAAHAVAIDHDAGIAVGHVLAAHRRHDRLIIDAGIGHQDAERLEGGNRAALEIEHPRLLLQSLRLRKIGAARVGDARNADLALALRKLGPAFQPFHTGAAERLGVGHDMGLRHRDEIRRAEIGPDLYLMFDRPLPQRTEFAAAHRLFFVVQLHNLRGSSRSPRVRSAYWPTTPAALISGTHLSTSELTKWRNASGER